MKNFRICHFFNQNFWVQLNVGKAQKRTKHTFFNRFKNLKILKLTFNIRKDKFYYRQQEQNELLNGKWSNIDLNTFKKQIKIFNIP